MHDGSGSLHLSVENGQVVSSDGEIYDVREAIDGIP